MHSAELRIPVEFRRYFPSRMIASPDSVLLESLVGWLTSFILVRSIVCLLVWLKHTYGSKLLLTIARTVREMQLQILTMQSARKRLQN